MTEFEGNGDMTGADSDSGNSRQANAKGIFTALAEVPEKSILDEAAMGRAFNVTPRTIRRMVTRHEIPPPIKLGGRSVWISGRVLEYLNETADEAEKRKRKELSRIRSISPNN